ncbi:hypothetical protein CHS0354_015005 [Potamilus streckersoni]|uniref:Tetraspanin n=1 Tax=Potamilus streckersoni TaxID=2493646 RepID=A0AAE0VYG4_9BIVA|nr:hypothetical protein CHS0354_015005 [Potamilus streckersoni]
MGCFESCGRVIIVIFNIVFLIIGLVFLAGGLLIKFGSSLYKGALDTVEKSIEQSISNTGGGTVDVNLDLGSITEPVAYALIGVGVFVVLICFFGCCGACYKIKILLILYITLAIMIVVGEIVMVTLFLGFPSIIKTPLVSSLKSGIQSDFQDLTGTNLVSQAWNIAMQQFKCCGASDYSDFTGASKWNTAKYSGTCSCTLTTPLACCMTLPSGNTASDLTCATTPTTSNNYLNTGCVDKVWNDYIISNKIAVSVAISVLALFQVLLVVFAVVICCKDEKEKKKKNDVSPESANFNEIQKESTNSSWHWNGRMRNKVHPRRF